MISMSGFPCLAWGTLFWHTESIFCVHLSTRLFQDRPPLEKYAIRWESRRNIWYIESDMVGWLPFLPSETFSLHNMSWLCLENWPIHNKEGSNRWECLSFPCHGYSAPPPHSSYSLRYGIFTAQKIVHSLSNDEKCLHGGSTVILPFVCFNIAQLFLLHLSPTDIDDQRGFGVLLFKKWSNDINGVTVELFDAWGRKCHSDYSFRDVCQIKIVASLLISMFWASYNLPQQVHIILHIRMAPQIKYIYFDAPLEADVTECRRNRQGNTRPGWRFHRNERPAFVASW